jgi:hypothetical protein
MSTVLEEQQEEMDWGTIYTQREDNGWDYAVMLLRKYNDYRPPECLGDLAASLEEKGVNES